MTDLGIASFEGEHRWLSNFEPVLVALDGRAYPSVEHAYQAAKTLELPLREQFQDIHLSSGQAKRRGKLLPLRPDWEQVKEGVMADLLRQKFANPSLGQRLRSTGNRYIVEGNSWHDNFWGECECRRCRGETVAQNRLGHLLMQVRAELLGRPPAPYPG